ncbi:MFS transporter [Microbacterium sp. NPDC055683]
MTALAPYRLTRDRRYLLWLASDTASGLSNALSGFAIPLIALATTGDPAQAGILGAVAFAARLIATLAGGVLADRRRRIPLMRVGAVIGLSLAAAFTALAASGSLTFSALLAISTALAVRTGLFGVAGESTLKELVPDEAMGRAQAANQGRDAALSLLGSPLGGMLLAAGGWIVGAAMTACQVVAAATAWALGRGGSDAGEPPAAAPSRSPLADIREGMGWLLARRDLRGVLIVSTIVNLGFNAGLTTAIYAMQQDGATTTSLGWTMAAASAAMLAGAVASPALVARVRAGTLIVIGLLLAGLGIIALPFVHEPLAIAGVLAVAVVAIPALNAALLGYFTVATPSRLLGRANSALQVLSMGAMPLAPLVAGFGLAFAGRTGTLALASGLCVAAALVAMADRNLRSLPAEAGWAAHAAAMR